MLKKYVLNNPRKTEVEAVYLQTKNMDKAANLSDTLKYNWDKNELFITHPSGAIQKAKPGNFLIKHNGRYSTCTYYTMSKYFCNVPTPLIKWASVFRKKRR